MSMFSTISGKLKKFVAQGHKKFAIYPYGEIGIMVHDALSKQFGIDDIILIDNGLSKYNPKIIGVDELEGKDYSEYIFFVTYRYGIYYDEIRNSLKKYVASSQIVDLFPNRVKAGYYRIMWRRLVRSVILQRELVQLKIMRWTIFQHMDLYIRHKQIMKMRMAVCGISKEYNRMGFHRKMIRL